jgi:hypothetical protein
MAEPSSHYNKVEGSSPATTTGMEIESKNVKKKVPLVQPKRPFYAPPPVVHTINTGKTKEVRITVPLTSCLTGLESAL